MKTKSLIFAPPNDAHASAVRWAMKLNGVGSMLASSIRLTEASRLSVGVGNIGAWAMNSEVNLLEIKSVWMRLIELPSMRDILSQDEVFIKRQWECLQDNIFSFSDDFMGGLWVNDPLAARMAENKLLQLKVAKEVGLLFPEVVASNDVEVVRDFVDKFGKVIFKQFSGYAWRNVDTGRSYMSSPVILDKKSDLPERAIAICPGIYQKYIEKAYDVRSTIIGNKIFSARLMDCSRNAYIDWRPYIHDDGMVIENFELPNHIEEKLMSLMERLGIVLGCVDFAVGKDGDIYFLEVNQQGQFLFIEQLLPEMELLNAMTSMMIEGKADYDAGVLERGVHLSDYLGSSEYNSLFSLPRRPSEFISLES